MSEDAPEILLRPAMPEDIPGILALVREFVRKQLVLPRTAEELKQNYQNFILARNAGDPSAILGAGALRPYGDGLYELRSLVVDSRFQGKGIGGAIVRALLARAEEFTPPTKCVFTLTKRVEFFVRLGFHLVPRENFPAKIWSDCLPCPKYTCCDEVALCRDFEDASR